MTPTEQRERLLEYAAADTVLFLSPYPATLRGEQKRQWQPVLDAHNANGGDFALTESLRPALSAKAREYLTRRLAGIADGRLDAFCDLAGAYKSVLLALSVADGAADAAEAFDLSVLEELYQNKLWGEDADALTARENRKKAAVDAAYRLLKD